MKRIISSQLWDRGILDTAWHFLQAQAKVSDKEYLIEKIVAELNEMSLEELKELLEAIYNKNFIG